MKISPKNTGNTILCEARSMCIEAIDRAMSYLSMKTKIPDGESRVMQLVAPVRACLKCKSVDHLVWKCPRATPEEAKREEMKSARNGEATKKKTAPVNGWVSGSGEELRSVQ